MSRLASALSSGAAAAASSAPSGGRRVLVVGGNGYIGSHIVQELLSRRHGGQEPGLRVASISRSGLPPSDNPAWARDVEWIKGDALQATPGSPDDSFLRAAQGSSAVISAVGGFGWPKTMRRINGTANESAMAAAKAAGVPRFVYVSAHHYRLFTFLQKGYFEGKFAAERALQEHFGPQGVQIRPSFVYGTRRVGSFHVPLWLLGAPLQQVTSFSLVRGLSRLPVLGPFFALFVTPPVAVEAVAKAAVDAALAKDAPKRTIVDVDDLLEMQEH